MNKKLRERGIRKSLKFRKTELAAKFTVQFPVLAGLQQAKRCVLSNQGKNAVLCMDGLVHSHNADEISELGLLRWTNGEGEVSLGLLLKCALSSLTMAKGC